MSRHEVRSCNSTLYIESFESLGQDLMLGNSMSSRLTSACEEEFTSESAFVGNRNAFLLGRGALEPLLGLPCLAPT